MVVDDKIVSVSIIIPVFNAEPYIATCIRSVMRQRYEGPIECLLVDDGSTDKSILIAEELITEYQGPVSFKILHHDHTRGASGARNTGMDAATGDYFYFLDSDDELTPDCIEKLTAPLAQARYDVVVGSFDIVFDGIPFYQEQTLLVSVNTVLYDEEIVNAYKSKITPITPWNKLISADVVRRSGCRFREGIIMEDVLWEFQLACSIHTMYSVNQSTYIFNRRPGSVMTSSGWENKAYSYFIIFVEMCKFVRDKGVDDVLVYGILRESHHHALKFFGNARKVFVRTYKQMLEYYRPSLRKIFQGNHGRFKRCVRDIHFALPVLVAPYWCYYFNYHLLPHFASLKQRIKGTV